VVLALPLPIIFADQPLDLDDESQRALFHAGNRALMGRLYQESYDGVDAAVGRVLCGADRETVVHDLYLSVSRNCPRPCGSRWQGGRVALHALFMDSALDVRSIEERAARGAPLADMADPAAGEIDRKLVLAVTP